jgi:hypothetical protein
VTWTSFPVAEALYDAGAYWFRVPPKHALATDKTTGIRVDDYLLVQTAPRWTRSLAVVRDRWCVWRIMRTWGPEVFVGRVEPLKSVDPGELGNSALEEYYPVDTVDSFDTAQFYPAEERAAEDAVELAPKTVRLRFANLVGVSVKLDRVM